MRHRWSEEDDIVALYFYKFGMLDRSPSIDAVGQSRGMGTDSLRMRVENFRAIDAGGSLDHAAQQSRAVFQNYAHLSEPELRILAGI
ncbi:MAG: hypothetical protein WEB58_18825 [Planctomycetaceae bacterium]